MVPWMFREVEWVAHVRSVMGDSLFCEVLDGDAGFVLVFQPSANLFGPQLTDREPLVGRKS